MNKVMVIGRNPLELLGLKTILKSGFEVVVDTSGVTDALDRLANFDPNIVLLDVNLDGNQDLAEFSAEIKDRCPESKVMWLFSEEDEKTELAALKCSIDGCVLKTDVDHLPQALKLVLEEEVYFPVSFLKKWLTKIVSLSEAKNEETAQLSEREKEIVERVRAGMTNQEIAEELYISIETVKSHLKNVRRKMNLKRARQLSYSPAPSRPEGDRDV
ncbi:MAG: LuxR C-terminal-related transcriptional regulator [Terriglobia bacterium]